MPSKHPWRTLRLRMDPGRPQLIGRPFANEVECPICGKVLKYAVRLGDNRRRLGELWRSNRANCERHLDACYGKQVDAVLDVQGE